MADRGAPPSTLPPAALAQQRIKARNLGHKPVSQAIQLAMFRLDRDGSQPRIVKFGEMIARKAMEGDPFFVDIVVKRLDGLPTPVDKDGEDAVDNTALTRTLIEQLIASKRAGDDAKVIDVTTEETKHDD